MKKKVVSLLVAAMTVASLTACGNSGSDAPAANPAPAPAESEPAPAPEPAESEAPAPAESGAESEAPAPAADGEVISVGFAQVGHESDWRAANTKNYQDTFSAANGYELSFVDCDNDHAVQIETVRGFIEQELDYICIAPIQSAGWDTVLQEAKDAGIPVLIVDRAVDADPSLYTTALD